MPRPRTRSLFELGGQWIAHEAGKGYLYRYWYDEGTGHSRRASLGTANLEEAKTRLAEIIIKGEPKTNDSYLAQVLEIYFTERTDHLASKGAARQAGKLMLECWGELTQVGAINHEKQKKFVKWSIEKKDHAISYVARNLGVLAAALEHARLGVEIIYSEGAILDKWPELKPKPKREIYEPTDEELARFFAAGIPENFRRWLLNSMATMGRPEAVLELGPNQRQHNLGLIDLNPPGRRQNKKYRATVRELPSQTKWLNKWEKEGLEQYGGKYCGYASVDSLDSTLERWRDRQEINVPFFSSYSVRHRATSILRASKKPRVPGEQLSYQMGHKRPVDKGEARTTRGYGRFGPDYLEEAARVLEAWVKRVLSLAKKKPKAAQARNLKKAA